MKKVSNSSIWFEKYKPKTVEDLILPLNLKDKLLNQVKTQKIPHLLLCSNTGGCLLPGSNITVFKESNFKTVMEISKIYGYSKKRISKLFKNQDMVDINEITKEVEIVLKDTGLSSLYCMASDEKYNDKHLKLSHWLTKLNISEAINKTKTLRKYSKFFDFEITDKYWADWKKENLKETIQKIKFKLIYTNFKNITDIFKISSILSKSFWEFRGYSENEAIEIISKIQRNRSNFCSEYWESRGIEKTEYDKNISIIQVNNFNKRVEKYTNEELRNQRGYGQTLDKFLNLGYTQEESEFLLKERQTTFSLKKCIEKYGEEDGLKIFNNRQEKWQNTLNMKSDEEKERINKAKAITLENMIKKWGISNGHERYNKWLLSTNPGLKNKLNIDFPGKLYYIKFYNDELEFWKIGITKLEVVGGRFENKDVFLSKYNLKYDIIFIQNYDSYLDCFEKEQEILTKFSKNRIIINYNGFKTSEAFNINILKDINEKI